MQGQSSPRNKLAIGVFTLLIAAPLLLASVQSRYSLFVFRDGFATHYPIKKVFIHQIKQNEIPYWNPAASFGQPLLANPNNLPFYPDNLLYLILPFDVTWNFHFWFHWIFGAFGIFLLLKKLNAESQTALIGCIWWAGSGFVLSLFSFYNMIAAASWIPWMLLSLRLLVQYGKWRDAAALGLCAGLQFLSGEPVTSLSTWLLLLIFCLEWRKEFTPAKIGLIAAGGILSLLIVLPQLMALSEIYSYTSRSMVEHSLVTSSNSSLEPQRLLEWLVPYSWGIPYEKAPQLFLGKSFSHYPFFIHSIHLSLLLLLCFILAIRKIRPVMITGIVLFLLLCLGRYTPIWKALFDYFPGFSNIRFPIKFFSAFLLFLIVIASRGVDNLRQGSSKSKPFPVLFLAGIWLFAVAGYLFAISNRQPFFIQQIVISGAVLLTLSVVILRFRSLLLLFVIIEAVIGARFLWLGVSKSDLLPPTSASSNSRTFVSPEMFPVNPDYDHLNQLYRDESSAAFPLWGAPFGFRYAFDDSPEGLYSYYNDYLNAFFQSLPPAHQFRLLSVLGVSQAVTKQNLTPDGWDRSSRSPYYTYSTNSSWPLLFPAKKVIDNSTPEQSLRGLLQAEASFARWKTGAAAFVMADSFHFKEVETSKYRIDLQSDGPVMIVSRITYFPAWKATGTFPDGKIRQLKVNQVDFSFVGIEVPAGVKSVFLIYDSRVGSGVLLAWGVFLTGICVIVATRGPHPDGRGRSR